MDHNGLFFLLKIIFVLPYKLAIESYKLAFSKTQPKRPVNLDVFFRIFMREAFLLANKYSGEQVLNPLFIGLNHLTKFVLNLQAYPTESILFTIDDIKTEIFSKYMIKEDRFESRYEWFYKPESFDPTVDAILLYFHGGGFAIELLSFIFIYLKNLSKYYPRMAIVVSNYTVTNSKIDYAVYPLPIFESIVLYKHFSETIGCKNVKLMGESAGGNIVLSLLQYLSKAGIQFPSNAVVISPWLNPSSITAEERLFMLEESKLDSLSYQGLDLFQQHYIPNNELKSMYSKDPLLNIESNFDPTAWNLITKACHLFVSYGDDEILQLQIARFIDKLDAHCPNFNLKTDSFLDVEGGHIRPILYLHTDLDKWKSSNTVQKVLRALK